MSEQEFKVGDTVKVWGPMTYGDNYRWGCGIATWKVIDAKRHQLVVAHFASDGDDPREFKVHPRQCELVKPAAPKVGDEVELFTRIDAEDGGSGRFYTKQEKERCAMEGGIWMKVKGEVVEVPSA